MCSDNLGHEDGLQLALHVGPLVTALRDRGVSLGITRMDPGGWPRRNLAIHLSGSTSRELKDALDIQGGGLEQHWVNESRVSWGPT